MAGAFNFTLDPSAGDSNTRCFAFKFNGPDEDANNAPELRGQFLGEPSHHLPKVVEAHLHPRPRRSSTVRR